MSIFLVYLFTIKCVGFTNLQSTIDLLLTNKDGWLKFVALIDHYFQTFSHSFDVDLMSLVSHLKSNFTWQHIVIPNL